MMNKIIASVACGAMLLVAECGAATTPEQVAPRLLLPVNPAPSHLSLHVNGKTLDDSFPKRFEAGKIVVAYQGGLGSFDLESFPADEQVTILKIFNVTPLQLAQMKQAERENSQKSEEQRQKQAEQAAAYDKQQQANGLVKMDGQWMSPEQAKQMQRVRCPKCNGVGTSENTEEETCLACNGTGRNTSNFSSLGSSKSEPCNRCRGTGQVTKNVNAKCELCKGSGSITAAVASTYKVPPQRRQGKATQGAYNVDEAKELVTRYSHIKVKAMINDGRLQNAEYVATIFDPRNSESCDGVISVYYDFTFTTQGGLTRRNRGYLYFYHDPKRNDWFNSDTVIDGLPRYGR